MLFHAGVSLSSSLISLQPYTATLLVLSICSTSQASLSQQSPRRYLYQAKPSTASFAPFFHSFVHHQFAAVLPLLVLVVGFFYDDFFPVGTVSVAPLAMVRLPFTMCRSRLSGCMPLPVCRCLRWLFPSCRLPAGARVCRCCRVYVERVVACVEVRVACIIVSQHICVIVGIRYS